MTAIPDRAQVLDLIFKSPVEHVASPLESGVDGLGDTWHRFEISDGQERRGVILTITELRPALAVSDLAKMEGAK